MKYIIGILIGLLFFSVGVIYAKINGMELVNKLDIGWGTVYKVYDNDNHAVCYAYANGYAGGISCLK